MINADLVVDYDDLISIIIVNRVIISIVVRELIVRAMINNDLMMDYDEPIFIIKVYPLIILNHSLEIIYEKTRSISALKPGNNGEVSVSPAKSVATNCS